MKYFHPKIFIPVIIMIIAFFAIVIFVSEKKEALPIETPPIMVDSKMIHITSPIVE